ncbi:MAG: dimethylargininase [Acidobacteria bacterium]|nr:dimethylargininase [Acidobacteriota bacterium]
MLIAITREVSPAIADCELTHLEREPIDPARAAAQHHEYERCLEQLGCRVQRLPVEPTLPDSVFVEDAAVVVEELAVITRPGAVSRRPEVVSVAQALKAYRPHGFIESPGTLDGGDVLRLGKTLFVGLTQRTNPEGIRQLAALLAPFGYEVRAVPIADCLHLKTAVTQVTADTLLINQAWIDASVFAGWKLIDVDAAEPFAANALQVGDTVIYPTSFPATRAKLEHHKINVLPVDASELGKAEGGVTCCSLIFPA